MPQAVSKITKKVSRKKGNINSLHENSRDAQRIRRASARDDKVTKLSATRAKINQPHLQRVAFFQGAAKATPSVLDIAECQRLVEGFIHRDDEDLAKLKKERRPGRPASTRQDLLEQRIATEEREYDSGFWIPDLVEEDNFHKIQLWSGEWTSLNTMRYVRVNRSGEVKESSFPPKGQS
ncbi:MAG: hypothetical protein MMC23_006828 [Stictis urceolatum]|nr:hypothetical protein [Stictis urceolata]